MKIERIVEKFRIYVAKSRDTNDYSEGDMPFVTSAETTNGIVRKVEPLDGDRLFSGPCVVISGLGFATFHTDQFIPKGNGGDSCCVLYSIAAATPADYIAFAAAFNSLHKWRFSYGRKCNKNRIAVLSIPWPLPAIDQSWLEESAQIEKVTGSFGKAMHVQVDSRPAETEEEAEGDSD